MNVLMVLMWQSVCVEKQSLLSQMRRERDTHRERNETDKKRQRERRDVPQSNTQSASVSGSENCSDVNQAHKKIFFTNEAPEWQSCFESFPWQNLTWDKPWSGPACVRVCESEWMCVCVCVCVYLLGLSFRLVLRTLKLLCSWVSSNGRRAFERRP